MRSPLQITAAAAFLVADLSTTGVLAHPGGYTQDETPTLDVSLTFCEVESDGACCTPTQETDAIGVYNLYGPLTGQCALDYAKVRRKATQQIPCQVFISWLICVWFSI